MKKTIWKKSIAIFMAATMMATMTGCGGKDGGSKKSKDQAEADTKDMIYEATDFPLEGLEGEPSTISVQNGKLYIETYEWIENESGEDKDKQDDAEDTKGTTDSDAQDASSDDSQKDTASDEAGETEDNNNAEEADKSDSSEEEKTDTDEESGDAKTDADEESDDAKEETGDTDSEDDEEEYYKDGTSISRLYSVNLDGSDLKEIPMDVPEEEGFYNVLIAPDDTMVYSSYQYNDKTDESSVALVRLGADGKEQQREIISDSLDLGEYASINGLKIDSKGNILVLGEQKIFILDENFKSQGELKIDGETYLAGAALTKDGQIVCGESIYKNETSTVQVQVLDLENKKWGEAYPVEIGWFSSSDSVMDGSGDYDFFYKDESGIYGYDISRKKGTKLMDYVASNLTSDNTWGIIPTGDGRFVGTEYDYESENGNASIVIYNKVDPSTVANRKTITFGAMWISDDVKRAAIEFNKQSTEYQIEFKDYSNEEDPQTKMTADIIAGNVPDIIDLAYVSLDQYASKGLLEDLTPYIEKDSEINTEDIIPSVYEAMQSDGKLYYVAPSMSIYTLAGKKKNVGTETGWTYDDLKALLAKSGKDTQLFYMNQKKIIMEYLLGVGLTDFINWETGECSFDSQDFKDLMEIANENGIDGEPEWNEDMPGEGELFHDDKVLLSYCSLNIDEFCTAEETAGDELNYIGFPNKDKQGSYFIFNNQIAMYSKSDVKDGAWEFIRNFMTKEYQGKMDSYFIPTRQDCFDLYIEAAMATKEYTNELGREIHPREGSYGDGNREYEVKPMTQKQADEYIAIINNTKKSGQYDWSLVEIVEEEADHYFAGEKSLDETADIIQNRIKTYVNENR